MKNIKFLLSSFLVIGFIFSVTSIPVFADSEVSPNAHVRPGPGSNHDWKHAETTHHSNVVSNNITKIAADTAIIGAGGGLGGVVGKHAVFKAAGFAIGKRVSSVVPAGTNTWWTTIKYYDIDQVGNVYVKYKVNVYSNSSRTNLIDSYTTVADNV